MIGNNGGGNPHHDASGKFTSKGNDGFGAQVEKQQVNPQKIYSQMGLNQEDIAAEQERQEKIGALKKQKETEIHKEQENRQEALNDLGAKMDKLENNGSSLKQNIMDRYSKLSDEQKKDFALNVFHYGTDMFDNPIGKFRNPYTGEIMYADADSYEDRSDFLLNNNGQMEATLDDIIQNGATQEDLERLFNEHDIQDLESLIDEEDLDYQISDIETRLVDLENHAPYGLSIGEQETQKELENKLNQLKAKRDSNSKVLNQMGLGEEDLNKSANESKYKKVVGN